MTTEQQRIIMMLDAFSAFCDKIEKALIELRRTLAEINADVHQQAARHNIAPGIDNSDEYDPPLR